MTDQDDYSEMWRSMLTGEATELRNYRAISRWLPSEPRCAICYAPFGGIGAAAMRVMFQKKPSTRNPRFCNDCERFAEKHPGGAELEITMLFADVRGSTSMAEGIGPLEFTRLLNRFYAAATSALIPSNAWIDKFVGDEVIALFIPGFVGQDHAQTAIHTAQKILKAVGYRQHSTPWIPIGIGVHTDTVYFGSVGSAGGITDITALGDGMNTTARLVSSAAAGEVLVSDTAAKAASLDLEHLEARQLELKGKSESVTVHVMHADTLLHERTHA